jgi:hypothetical protein
MALDPDMPVEGVGEGLGEGLDGAAEQGDEQAAVMSVDSSGMTTTGMTPRTPLCTFQPAIQRATNRRRSR